MHCPRPSEVPATLHPPQAGLRHRTSSCLSTRPILVSVSAFSPDLSRISIRVPAKLGDAKAQWSGRVVCGSHSKHAGAAPRGCCRGTHPRVTGTGSGAWETGRGFSRSDQGKTTELQPAPSGRGNSGRLSAGDATRLIAPPIRWRCPLPGSRTVGGRGALLKQHSSSLAPVGPGIGSRWAGRRSDPGLNGFVVVGSGRLPARMPHRHPVIPGSRAAILYRCRPVRRYPCGDVSATLRDQPMLVGAALSPRAHVLRPACG